MKMFHVVVQIDSDCSNFGQNCFYLNCYIYRTITAALRHNKAKQKIPIIGPKSA